MADTPRTFTVAPVVPGNAMGPALLLQAPLSFWGGYDATTGAVIDQTHPHCGQNLAGTVLLMSCAKGSSSSSSVLAEAIRAGTAPAAIIMRERDLIVALGSLVASELYGVRMPVVIADEDSWQALSRLPAGVAVSVTASDMAATVTRVLTDDDELQHGRCRHRPRDLRA